MQKMSESYKEEIKDAKIIIKQKRIRKMPNATVNKLTENGYRPFYDNSEY